MAANTALPGDTFTLAFAIMPSDATNVLCADTSGAGAGAAHCGRLHMDPAADKRLHAAVPVGILFRTADFLHDDLPCLHRPPLQQVLAP